MQRLTHSQIKVKRDDLLQKQGGRCALCQLPCRSDDAVLDHDHKTGAIRGALHRSCNALLGKVENNAPRFGVRELAPFLHGAARYLLLHTTNVTGLLHPTHKTEDEKRLARNAAAKKRRAAAKEKV